MERRSFERLPKNNFLTYKSNRFSSEVESMTNNISLKGACILTEKKLRPQKNIKLKFFLGPKIGIKEVKSRVIYSKPVNVELGKGFLSGVEFAELIFKERKDLSNNDY